MNNNFLITTTGATPSIILNDLGQRILVHPLVDYNIGTEFKYTELMESLDFNNALDFGYLTASYNGVGLTSSSGISNVPSSDNRLYIQNAIEVKKNPGLGEFSSIKAAVDSITSATFNSQWVINVGPGLFIEDTITLKPYVHIKGSDRSATTIQVDNPSKNAVIGARTSSITDCTIQGATSSGYSAIYFSNNSSISGETYAFLVEECSFGANNILIHTVGATGAATSLVASGIIKGTDSGNYVQGFVSENSGGLTTTITLRNSQVIASTTTTEAIYATGSSAQIIISSTSISRLGVISQTAVRIANGGSVRMFAVDIRSHTKGVWMDISGTAPTISAVGINMTLNTQDIVIDHPSATGLIDGVFNRTNSTIDPSSTVVLNGLDRRIVRVAKIGADFQSVKDAINNIIDASPTNRYVVSVGPGIFTEDTIYMKPYVDVMGTDNGTKITINDPSKNIIIGCSQSSLSYVTLHGATSSGYSAVSCSNIGFGELFTLDKVTFGDNYKLVDINSSEYSLISIADCSCESSALFNTGIKISGTGSSVLNLTRFRTIISPYANVDTFLDVSGVNNRAIINNVGILNYGTVSNGLKVYDGSFLDGDTFQCQNMGNSIIAPNIGSAPTIRLSSITIYDPVGNSINIQHPGADGYLQGVFDNDNNNIAYVDPSSPISLNYSDPHGTGTFIAGNIYQGINNSSVTNITQMLQKGNLGVLDGATMSYSGLTVSVDAGEGYLVKTDGSLKFIAWTQSKSISIGTYSHQYLYIDENNNLQKTSSAPSYTQMSIGRVQTDSNSIIWLQKTARDSAYTSTRLDESLRVSLGSIFKSGCIVTENNTPFKLDVTSGEYWYSIYQHLPSASQSISWYSFDRNGSGGWEINQESTIQTQYDTDTLGRTGLTGSNYAKHALYLVGDGADQKYSLVYGQEYFTTILSAENGGLPSPPSFFSGNNVPIAAIIVQAGATAISEIRDIRPTLSFKAESTSAANVHGNLLNLGNDDHTQYLLVNGTRPMGGNLDLGSNQITNSGTINGVDITSHASRHLPNGSDPLANGTASTIGSTNQQGIQNAFSRQDHIHAHGTHSDPTYHSISTQTSHGFMSSTDKIKLDIIATNSITLSNKTLLSTDNNVIDATRLQTFTISTTSPTNNNILRYNGTGWSPTTGVILLGYSTGTSSTLANSIVESNFTNNGFSYSIPANTLNTNSTLRVTTYGKYSTKNGSVGTLTIRLKLGSVTYNTTIIPSFPSSVVNAGIKIEGQFQFRSIGSSGTVFSHLLVDPSGVISVVSTSNGTASVDTTISNVVQLSGQWSTADTSNVLQLEQIIFELLN